MPDTLAVAIGGSALEGIPEIVALFVSLERQTGVNAYQSLDNAAAVTPVSEGLIILP